MSKEYVYIGLGSNLQEPIQQLHAAINALVTLPETCLVERSSFYSSDSLLDGQPSYINAVVCLETSLNPEVLLDFLQNIENNQGRIRGERWGARTLDLDIILYGQRQINSKRLVVPHAQMAFRSFVLEPLLEIAPNILLPNGEAISTLLANCPLQNLKRLKNY